MSHVLQCYIPVCVPLGDKKPRGIVLTDAFIAYTTFSVRATYHTFLYQVFVLIASL